MRPLIVLLIVAAASCGQRSVSTAPAPPVAPAPASLSPPPSAPPAPKATDALTPVYSKALEGDMRAALDRLAAIPVEALDSNQRRQRACMIDTFSTSKGPIAETPDPLLTRVIAAYRDYWVRMMVERWSKEAGRGYLFERLRAVLAPSIAGPSPTLDGLLDALGAALAERGYHSLRGVTAPYQDLMVWTTETRRTYDVRVPDGARRVEVVMMRNFLSLGWEGLATCDRYHVGGWAEKDRLFCMADAYDPASEDFSVSYLVHETQHFVDYEQFPKLEGPELEYRAKLAEIIASQQTTRAHVALFVGHAGESRDASHSYANGCVVRDLQRALDGVGGPRWWESVPEDRLRRAAREVFDASTRQLVAKGAATVSRIL